jgi:hypothetical protein
MCMCKCICVYMCALGTSQVFDARTQIAACFYLRGRHTYTYMHVQTKNIQTYIHTITQGLVCCHGLVRAKEVQVVAVCPAAA